MERKRIIQSLLFLLQLNVLIALKDDPCTTAKNLPNFELRLKAFKIDLARGDRPICDRYFIKEPGEWFRTVDGNEMVNKRTTFFECGTQYSIYMQGNVPSSLNRVVNRTACVIPSCTTKYNIQLKKCSNFTVYYLPRPSSCDQAYCFGFGENGIAPNITTDKPTVKYELVKSAGKTAADLSEQKLAFKCQFTPVVDGTNIIYYKVFWYVNDHTSTIFASQAVPKERLPETYLRGETGLDSIKLNIEISCKVRLYYHPKGPPGPSSEISEKFFAGIKPLKRTYEISRGNTTSIEFKMTVPFGCMYANHNDPDPLPCKHTISLTTPDYLKCSQGIYAVDMCGKLIESRKWNETQIISIKHKNDNNYRTIQTFEVHTETKVRIYGEPFWDGVELPTVFINVIEGDNKWKNAICEAVSDPHMASFTNRHYDSQEPGTYTLYKNKDPSGNINEIQMKVTPCNHVKNKTYEHMNQCACGIAARSSSDVYIIDRCPETVPSYFGFKSCVEDILNVMKRANNEHDYEIHFPSGTSIDVSLKYFASKIRTLELHMHPSIADERRSQGLCGTVGKDKLLDPNNVDLTSDPKSFALSWKVADADNMFMMSLERLQSFPKTQKAPDLCICEKPSLLSGTIKNTVTCTNSKGTLISCEKDKMKPVQKDVCYERHNRRKRSAKHSFTFVPKIVIKPKWKRSKRAISVSNIVMTKAQAKIWCENYMNSSLAFLACQDIPNTNSTRAIEICMLDILSTNSTVFATAPRESMKASCLKEIARNDTLMNVTKNGEKLAEKILSITCPGECSGHGVCVKGVCQCNDGFGGGDCSVDINEPPPVYAVNYETGGLCDKLFCKEAIVDGDLFLDRSGLTCKMQRFEMTMNGTSLELETSYVPGSHNTLSDIRCKFPRSISKRSTLSSVGFITGYKIAVSNNNKNFSDAHAVYILDSTCQDTLNVSGQLRFALKPGFCFIHGSCVPDGVQKKCYECDIRQNKFEWTYRETEKGCTKEENSHLWVIGVVLAVLLLILIGLVFFYILKKKHRIVQDSFGMTNPQRQASKYSK
ncbi:von Willebrand factor D and EGF domain-containing protein [Magallana gigas]|uniref:von Willebrand factor D and EGF domain-containing protein n=1 Tax=Magallana gigas TaxID=29159 RepID=UPI00333F05C0